MADELFVAHPGPSPEEERDMAMLSEMIRVVQRAFDLVDRVDDVDTFAQDVAGHLFDLALGVPEDIEHLDDPTDPGYWEDE